METTTSFAPRPPPLRLRTSPKDLDTSQCTRCFEAHASNEPCRHPQRIPPTIPSSDYSSYTARIWPSTASSPSCSSSSSPRSTSNASLHTSSWPVDSDSDAHSSSKIKVRISKHALPSSPPVLRRKISPTETSLRDIRASQQRLLQAKESEDQLRVLYERQTMEYLFGDFASLDTLGGL